MANNTIQILRSYTNTAPTFLYDGQLAYSFVNDTLYIGNTAQQVRVIGGANTVSRVNSGYNVANNATLLAQQAYDAANAAGSSAAVNAASSYANSAFVKANSAYAQANSAQSHAQAAFNAANNASVAQSAFIQANAAFAAANNNANTITLVQGVDTFQNTLITAAQTHASQAFNRANGALSNTGGTINGSLSMSQD